LRQAEAGVAVKEQCRQSKFSGGTQAGEATLLREPEPEADADADADAEAEAEADNVKPKKLLAEAHLTSKRLRWLQGKALLRRPDVKPLAG
jgi:hypothetical protein